MLVGHTAIYDKLLEDASHDRLHHAQLFIGPEHVGKTKTALKLAVHLQGAEENVLAKRQILEGLDSDTLLFLDAGEGLGIEEVRGILKRCSEGHQKPYLIVVIENIGRMKAESCNALLKTLEEPHPGTLFFLTAHREEDVLPTIRSRAHVNLFQTVSDAQLSGLLEGHPLSERLLFFAMGRPGKLIRLMNDSTYLDAHETLLRDLTEFMENPRASAVFPLTRKYESSELLEEFLDVLLKRVRHWLLRGDTPQVLSHLDLSRVLEQTEDAKLSLRNNVNAKLLLENLLLPFVP